MAGRLRRRRQRRACNGACSSGTNAPSVQRRYIRIASCHLRLPVDLLLRKMRLLPWVSLVRIGLTSGIILGRRTRLSVSIRILRHACEAINR